MYTNIINPTNNQSISLFSYEGKHLLKQYVQIYQNGGTLTSSTKFSKSKSPKSKSKSPKSKSPKSKSPKSKSPKSKSPKSKSPKSKSPKSKSPKSNSPKSNSPKSNSPKSETLSEKCSKPLYNLTPKITDEVEKGCDIHTYSNDHENSIEFILGRGLQDVPLKKRKKIINKRKIFTKEISKQVVNKLKDLEIGSGKTTILGPVEDIVGLLMHFFEEKENQNSEYKDFVILSVKEDVWTTDLNHDFINCSIDVDSDQTHKFEGLNDKCPIVLISTKQNILEVAKPDVILDPTRVTHCEVQWVRKWLTQLAKLNIDKKYSWKTYDLDIKGVKLYINCLIRNNEI
jgi:DNA mismatch repair ATPase MutL